MTKNNDDMYSPITDYLKRTIVASQQMGTISEGGDPVSNPISFDKPILGFLYSISRMGLTEYWPLKIGKNNIGKNYDCEVRLAEQTVSDLHARLVIQQMKNPEKIVASLRDEGSTNGTMVNGVNIGFDNVEIKNGDILTIGDNYKLLFILIDKKEYGLAPAENFIPMDDFSEIDDTETQGFYDPGVDDMYKKGTVAYDGSTGGEAGGTKVN